MKRLVLILMVLLSLVILSSCDNNPVTSYNQQDTVNLLYEKKGVVDSIYVGQQSRMYVISPTITIDSNKIHYVLFDVNIYGSGSSPNSQLTFLNLKFKYYWLFDMYAYDTSYNIKIPKGAYAKTDSLGYYTQVLRNNVKYSVIKNLRIYEEK